MKNKTLKRVIVKAAWWLLPMFGATMNSVFGGRKVTGLYGSYEQQTPNDDHK